MKKLLSVIAILLCMSAVSAYSQNDKSGKQDAVENSSITVQQSDSSNLNKLESKPVATAVSSAVAINDEDVNSGNNTLLYVALGLSALCLIAVVLLLLMLKKQRDVLDALDARYYSKLVALEEDALTESRVKKIAETVAKDYAEDVQTQVFARMQAVMMANESAKLQQTKTDQVSIFVPKTLYASFSPSYCGFRGDELSEDQTSYATFCINTVDKKHASYQLLENVSSSLIDSSQLEALDYSGNAQSYSCIRLVEPGELEYVDGSDYWQIKRKAVISFE